MKKEELEKHLNKKVKIKLKSENHYRHGKVIDFGNYTGLSFYSGSPCLVLAQRKRKLEVVLDSIEKVERG